MGKRRESRELAIQFLYQMEVRSEDMPDNRDLELFWGLFTGPFRVTSSVKEFSLRLVRGVLEHKEEIDATIQRFTSNWQLNRIAIVDLNILRVALFEMLYCPEIPPIVSINEGVEIAKRFSSRESGGFVNGILDRMLAECTAPKAGTSDPTVVADQESPEMPTELTEPTEPTEDGATGASSEADSEPI
jgi:N utilization substance protein B